MKSIELKWIAPAESTCARSMHPTPPHCGARLSKGSTGFKAHGRECSNTDTCDTTFNSEGPSLSFQPRCPHQSPPQQFRSLQRPHEGAEKIRQRHSKSRLLFPRRRKHRMTSSGHIPKSHTGRGGRRLSKHTPRLVISWNRDTATKPC